MNNDENKLKKEKNKSIIWTNELIKNEIKKYTTLKDFRENSNMCYSYLSKNSMLELLDNLIRSKKPNHENIWTKEEIDFLKENYIKVYTMEIEIDFLVVKLNKYKHIIYKKAKELGLTNYTRKEINTMRNKALGKNLSFEMVKEAALKYKTQSQFKIADPTSYNYANKYKFMKDISSHMIKKVFSIPEGILKQIIAQLFPNENIVLNDRQILKPKELDIYIPSLKLAFEYDGILWHKDDKHNKIEMCKKLGITLIKIKEKNTNYNKYVIDIKNQLIENINILLKFNSNLNTDVINNSKIDIKTIYDNVYDYNDMKEICQKYTNFTLFKKENRNIYEKLLRSKRLEEFTSHMTRQMIYWNDKLILKEVNKYTTLKEFMINSFGCYSYIIHHDKKYFLDNLIKRNNYKWNIDNIKTEISKYLYLKDFREQSEPCYNYILRNNLKFLLKDLNSNKISF